MDMDNAQMGGLGAPQPQAQPARKKPYTRFDSTTISDLSKEFYNLNLMELGNTGILRRFIFLCFWTGYHYGTRNIPKKTVVKELCEF